MAAPVALMGMACRFPGGSDTPDAFWNRLVSGRTAIGEIPQDRFSIAAHVDANAEAPGKSYSRWGGFIDDVAGFDSAMFEISPREAQTMDPQQRLLLMVAYEAMEDAGLTRVQLGQMRTGVFVGVSASDYAAIQRQQHADSDVYSGTGSALSIVANRLSHRFNLKGPSLSIDTACSSSLVALDQAVTALNSGRIDIAIVAGAHLLIDPSPFVAFSKAGMLSPTGRLSAFDRRANGYVRGEGIGAVLLMREADALYLGRRTRALIRATASNQDGRTPTLTAPDALAQRAMMRQLIEAAGMAPEEVAYVEAHGTGTPVGDPIEAAAIGHVFGGPLRQAPLLLGSVKPHIGHLEAAAGIASLIKAVLSLEHRLVPPSLNFEDPNPAIAFAAYNMSVPTAPTLLGAAGQPLVIAVNSFGFGGTNAGVLLESARPLPPAVVGGDDQARSVAVPLSAAGPEALRAVAGRLQQAIEQGRLAGSGVRDIAASMGILREGMGHRATVIAASREELLSGLKQVAEADAVPPVRGALPAVVTGTSRPSNRLAFTFAGQGGQWPGMARRLLADEPAFAAAFRDFDRTFEALSGWSVRTELLRDAAESRLHQSRYAMPAIFGVQLGLSAFWRACGLRPEFAIGHSFGELAAAHLAGAIDLETATRMIHVRCQIRERIGRDGAMLAVGMDGPILQPLLADAPEIDIAALNSDTMVTLAGPAEAMAAFAEKLRREQPNVMVREVQSDTAWHSRQLAPLEDWFRAEIGDIAWQVPKLTFVSTVTGRAEVRLDADYWWRNLRYQVRYRDALLMALDLGANALLEVSPHRVLSGLNAANAAERAVPATIANSLVRNEDDFRALAVAAGQLHSAGVALDWRAMGGGIARAAGLPTYPWQLVRHWRLSEEADDQLHSAPAFHLLGRRQRGPDPIWTNEISLGAFPYLADHVVGGDVVFPATGYLEIMLGVGRELMGEQVLELEDFEIGSALFLGREDHVLVSTRFDPRRHRVDIHTRTRGGAAEWTLRASARLRPTDVRPGLDPVGVDASAPPLRTDLFYARAAELGFNYGPAFRGVLQATSGGDYGAARIALPESLTLAGSAAHPALLDAALQLVIPILDAGPDAGTDRARYVPKRLKRVRLAGVLTRRLAVEAQILRGATGELGANYRLVDAAGQCRLTIEGLEMVPMGQQAVAAEPERVQPDYYAETYIAFVPGEPALANGKWVVLAAGGAMAPALSPSGIEPPAMAVLSTERGQGGDFLATVRSEVATLIADADSIVFDARAARAGEDSLVADSERLALQLIATAQAIQSRPGQVRRLVVLTAGSRQLPQDPPMTLAGLAGTGLVGLTRTIAAENPDLLVRQIDCLTPAPEVLASVLANGLGDETELVARAGGWFVPRLVADTRAELPRGLVDIDPSASVDTFQLTMKAPGSSSGLFLEACAMPGLAAGEVLVDTAAVGLNFRDVMAVTGLLPAGAEPDPAWLSLGLEFAGTVRAVGAGVADLLPGDRVMGMARACLRGVICAPARTLSRVPDGLSLDAAATIPSAFATAHYALAHAGRLRRGERVLIHMGTGGVGLAAIQVARALGAEIYATAGSAEKRDHLRQLGIAHVFNSRSLGFADAVLAATGGRGVDVVLNALPSHFITKGLDVLAPFGRFLEIGKRDVYDDAALGLHALRRNIAFHVIDLAAMGVQRPDLLADVLAEVLDQFSRGTYQPLPVTLFPIERAAEAFDLMAKGRHIGKIVIGMNGGKVRARAAARRDLTLRADRSYLVTGGTSGFGVEIARWLGRHGAGHIVLASRSGRLEPRHDGLAAELQALGATLETVALDLTDLAAVTRFIAVRAEGKGSLAGIVHGAAVFRDGLLGQLDEGTIRAVLQPKMAGAWALHRALAEAGVQPDFFLSLSSVAQVLGSLGQANYVAANSFLDGFATYRAAHGLVAQTVSLGALAEAGFVAENTAMGSYLDSLGILPMPTADTLDLLDGLVGSSAVSRCVAAVDWARVQAAAGPAGRTPRLLGLMPGARKGDQKLRQVLATLPVAEWADVLQEFLVEEVARVLDVDPQSVPVSRPLAELGLDSLSSIELKNRIEARLAVTLTVAAFLQAPTLEKLSSVIAGTLADEARVQGAAGEDLASVPDTAIQAAHSPLQLWALQLALAPMTSPAGRAALERTASGSMATPRDRAAVERSLANLCATVPHLRLTLSPENRTLIHGAGPCVTIVPDLAEALARPLALEAGELLRIVAVEAEGGIAGIGLLVHLAGGIDPASLLAALIDDDIAALRPAAALAGADRLAAEAGSRALLEPWISAPVLPGASRAGMECLAGLNIGPEIGLPILTAAADLTEARALAAFAEALAGLSTQDEFLVERFVGPCGNSVPIRLVSEPDKDQAMARIRHQLDLDAPMLDTAALELLLTDELDRAGTRLRQFGFSLRTEGEPRPPAWNALALHLIRTGAVMHVELSYDGDAIDRVSVDRVALRLRAALGEGLAPDLPRAAMVPHAAPPVVTAAPSVDVPVRGVAVSSTLANLLDAVSHPQASATLKRAALMCQAIRVRPGIDVPRLKRAVDTVVARHDFLGARFKRHEGEWRALTDGTIAPLRVHDLPDASDAELEARARQVASRPYDLATPPLFEVHLLRLGRRGDVVMVRLFEGLADGWSLGIVLDELLRAYIGLDLGPRPPGLAQIVRLATSGRISAQPSAPADLARLQLGPSRVRTLRIEGADTLRRHAMALGTTENGLLAAAFAKSLAQAGYGPQAHIGTYDPARRAPELNRAVAFLSRLVALDIGVEADIVSLARQLDAQFPDLAGKAEILGAVPDFIYAPLLPRQMLDQSMFGPAMRQFSKGPISMMALEIEALDLAPGGLQEGRLQLRPLALEGRLELRFQYDIASFADADLADLARRVVANTGLPPTSIGGESLGEIFAAPEDLPAPGPALGAV